MSNAAAQAYARTAQTTASPREIEAQAAKYGVPGLRNVVPDHWLDEGEVLSFGDHSFEVLHCPGHAPGHVVFVNEAQRFAHVGAQRGMFSYTGLSPQQVARLRDEHAEPQPRQAIEFPEGPQDQKPVSTRVGRDRQIGPGIGKAFIDNQSADLARQSDQVGRGKSLPVRIVGVDDDGKGRAFQI